MITYPFIFYSTIHFGFLRSKSQDAGKYYVGNFYILATEYSSEKIIYQTNNPFPIVLWTSKYSYGTICFVKNQLQKILNVYSRRISSLIKCFIRLTNIPSAHFTNVLSEHYYVANIYI